MTGHPPTRAALLSATADAQALYRRSLRGSWVFAYLYERKLADAISAGKLGYAPPGRDATLNHLRRRGHTDAAIIAAGLARRADTGQLVDVMRDRVTFPVLAADGQVAAFLGRSAPESKSPKYLNTPSTDIYVKGETLYGLAEETQRLNRGIPAVLVEGPLDRWAIKHADSRVRPLAPLAPCGTAVTAAQLRAIAAVSASPIILLADGDAAGQASVLHTWTIAREEIPGHPVLAAALPAGADPADMVAAGRYRDLDASLRDAQPVAHAALDAALGRTPATNPIHAAQIASSCAARDVPALPAGGLAAYVRHISERLHLPYADATAIALSGIGNSPHAPPEPLHATPSPTARVARPARGVSPGYGISRTLGSSL